MQVLIERSPLKNRESQQQHNVSTAIQKYALKAMDMLQLEIQRVEEETKILKVFVCRIMEYAGVKS